MVPSNVHRKRIANLFCVCMHGFCVCAYVYVWKGRELVFVFMLKCVRLFVCEMVFVCVCVVNCYLLQGGRQNTKKKKKI